MVTDHGRLIQPRKTFGHHIIDERVKRLLTFAFETGDVFASSNYESSLTSSQRVQIVAVAPPTRRGAILEPTGDRILVIRKSIDHAAKRVSRTNLHRIPEYIFRIRPKVVRAPNRCGAARLGAPVVPLVKPFCDYGFQATDENDVDIEYLSDSIQVLDGVCRFFVRLQHARRDLFRLAWLRRRQLCAFLCDFLSLASCGEPPHDAPQATL